MFQVALYAAPAPYVVMHPPLPLDQIEYDRLPTLPVEFDEQCCVPPLRGLAVQETGPAVPPEPP